MAGDPPRSAPRPPRGVPVERVRGERPEDPAWRADALAASRHSRLTDELREPLEDPDPARAARLCGEVCRALLLDFAPAVMLLPPGERRRAQALAAYARTLFDFAAQRGVEGERLAQINRWEFELERALGGDPLGQPVFVAMAAAERERPWPRAALDELGALARRRAGRTDAPGRREAAEARALGETIAAALLPGEPPPRAGQLAAALLRLGAALARPTAVPGAGDAAGGPQPTPEPQAADRELRALLLASARVVPELPAGYRRAALYLLLAGSSLLGRLEEGTSSGRPARLGALTRIALLARARWLGR